MSIHPWVTAVSPRPLAIWNGIGILFELLSTLNRFADSQNLETGKAPVNILADFKSGVVVLKELSQILGLFWEPIAAPKGDAKLVGGLQKLLADLKSNAEGQTPDELMQRLIALRAEARKTKNFATADTIRKRLGELGVTLEDRPGGTGWRVG